MNRRMRREDIRLLARARQGDIHARCEAGRRYLYGGGGFPKHVTTGLGYLNHPSVKDLPEAAQVIAEALPLQDILALQQERALHTAASAGVRTAQAKLGAWLCLTKPQSADGRRWLDLAAAQGHEGAGAAAAVVRLGSSSWREDLLRAFSGSCDLDAGPVAIMAARVALTGADLGHAMAALRCVLGWSLSITPETAVLVMSALRKAQQMPVCELGIDPQRIEQCLDALAAKNDGEAAFMLGRALCGMDSGPLRASALVSGCNMRKGSALLLRAADAGFGEAWADLYRVHADQHASVANPTLARFFLEKAAIRGEPDAQRRLGLLILRSATCLEESEQGTHWLHQAAVHGDVAAIQLLRTLVLPVAGSDDDADAGIEAIRREFPWLAIRLKASRDFGLTRLEGLCVDLPQGVRPWGLVVGRNPFIRQPNRSAPRVIPAITPSRLQRLEEAASRFEQACRDNEVLEGNLQQRSLRLRRAFERYGLQDSMFFAKASSAMLQSLRQGPKWAFSVRRQLQAALARGRVSNEARRKEGSRNDNKATGNIAS